MLRFYSLCTTLLFPLIWAWLHLRMKRGKEDTQRFSERFGKASLARPNGFVVWIHAASVGESNSVIPLMNKLHDMYDDVTILLTTGTVSSAKTIKSRLPERAFHQYVPVDVPFVVKRFMAHWKPDLAIWVESDIWPNLIQEAHRHSVPMALINARMSAKSHQKWMKARQSFLQLMKYFALVYAGSDEDLRRFKNLGVKKVKYVGNLKYDSPTLLADPQVTSEILSQIKDRHVWLAASTHAGEEAFMAETHLELKEIFPDVLTLLVPRHPHRAEEIREELSHKKLTISCRSKSQAILPETDIYIADTMGELGIFYRLAGIAFIGGSLVPHGGHNPIEPAQLDCAILCGPHMQNFRSITRELQQEQAIMEVQNAHELAEKVTDLFRDQEAQEQLAQHAHRFVESKQGVVAVLLKDLSSYLPGIPEDEEVIEEAIDAEPESAHA